MGLEEVGVKLIVDGAASFSDAMSGALDAVTGFASMGLDALGKGFQFAFDQAVEGQKQLAGLEQLIKSTGGASGVTMDDVAELGKQFQNLAGGSDDAVNSIIEFGLRAGTISEDEMPAFIQSSLDLGAVMGDNATAARLLARAQEDPVGTLGTLRRAGILFTDQQQEQIKSMVAAGDTAGATDLLMQQLAATTGGAAAAQAETFAGKMEILQGRLGEAAETIGTAFLPIAQQLFDQVIAPAIPIVEGLATQFGAFVAGIATGSGPLTEFVAFLEANLPAIQETATAVFGSIVEIGTALWTMISEHLLPLFAGLFEAIFGQAPGAQETMTGLLTAIQTGAQLVADFVTGVLVPALSGWYDFLNANLVPAIAGLVAWLQVNVPIAIQATSDFWNNVLYPALIQVQGFIMTQVIPAITETVAWLQENLPPAIQIASDFFNTVILPALTAVYSFITTSVIPTITNLVAWLQTNLPPAIQSATDFFNTKLLPAITAIYDFIVTYTIPFITQLAELIGNILRLAVEGATLVFNTLLLPALTAVSDFVNTYVTPYITELGDYIKDTLSPSLSSFSDDVLDPISSAFSGIASAIKSVIGWIEKLNTALGDLSIPPDLTPGSPTPFELGLRGIAAAAVEASAALADVVMPPGAMQDIQAAAGFRRSAVPVFGGAGAGGPAIGTQTNNTVNVTAMYGREQSPASVWGDVSLGLTLAAM